MALKLLAEIGLDGSGFERGLSRLGSSLKGRLAGLFTTAVITGTVGRIKDLADQFNVTTEEMQKLDAAAKQNALSFDNVGAALVRLGQARRDAAEGNENLLAVFSKFGVSLNDLQNPALRNVDLLNKIGAAVAGMNLTARDRTELNDLLGKMGEKLEVVLRDAAKIEGLQIITDDHIRRIDEADKAVQRLGRNITNLAANAAGSALGFLDRQLTDIFTAITLGAGGMSADQINAAMAADDAVQKEMADAAAAGGQETTPGKMFEEKVAAAAGGRGGRKSADSLISVGNFLGAGAGAITDIQRKQLEYSRRTADGIDQLVAWANQNLNRGGDGRGANLLPP